MNIKETVRKGVQVVTVASMAFITGCEVRPAETVPQTTSTPVEPTTIPVLPARTRPASTGFPAYVEWCLPVEEEGGIIELPDGTERVVTGQEYLVLDKKASGVIKPIYPGQTVSPGHGELLKCKRKF